MTTATNTKEQATVKPKPQYPNHDVIGIIGYPGTGKTQLATIFAAILKQQYPETTIASNFWVKFGDDYDPEIVFKIAEDVAKDRDFRYFNTIVLIDEIGDALNRFSAAAVENKSAEAIMAQRRKRHLPIIWTAPILGSVPGSVVRFTSRIIWTRTDPRVKGNFIKYWVWDVKGETNATRMVPPWLAHDLDLNRPPDARKFVPPSVARWAFNQYNSDQTIPPYYHLKARRKHEEAEAKFLAKEAAKQHKQEEREEAHTVRANARMERVLAEVDALAVNETAESILHKAGNDFSLGNIRRELVRAKPDLGDSVTLRDWLGKQGYEQYFESGKIHVRRRV